MAEISTDAIVSSMPSTNIAPEQRDLAISKALNELHKQTMSLVHPTLEKIVCVSCTRPPKVSLNLKTIQDAVKVKGQMDTDCLNFAIRKMTREKSGDRDLNNSKHYISSDLAMFAIKDRSDLIFTGEEFLSLGDALSGCDKVLCVPVIYGDHWTLFAFNMKDKKLSILDSMLKMRYSPDSGSERKYSLHEDIRLKVCIALEGALANKYNFSHWDVHYPQGPQVPQQKEGSNDCGFLVFNFMRHWNGHELVGSFPTETMELRKEFLAYILSFDIDEAHGLPNSFDRLMKKLPSEKAIDSTRPPLYKVAPETKILVEPCKALKSPFLVKRQSFCRPDTKLLDKLYQDTIADKLHIWQGPEDIQELMKDKQKMDAMCLNLAIRNMGREDAHDFRNTKCLGWRHYVDSGWMENSLVGCSDLEILQNKYRGSVLYNVSQSHMVFIPVIRGDHWTLYAFNMCDKKLSILDSLPDTTEGGDDPAQRHQKTRCDVCDALTLSMNCAIDFYSWEYEFPKLPRQQNSYDSGFFVFNFMRLWDGRRLLRWFPIESKELRKDFLAYILSCKENHVHLPNGIHLKIKDLPGKMMDCKLQKVAATGATLSTENQLAISISPELETSAGSSNDYICYFNSHSNPSKEVPAASSTPDSPLASSDFLSRCYRVTSDGDGVFHIAAKVGNVKLVDDTWKNNRALARVLLSAVNNRGDTTLHYAAFGGYNAMVKLLLGMMSGTGIAKFMRAQNLKGDTCLHEAVRYAPSSTVATLISKDLSIQDLSRPTLVQIVDNEGISPLYLATTLRRIDIVWALTRRPYKQDDKYVASYAGPAGKTALHAAVVLLDKELIKILLEWNDGLTSQGDESGSTPLHFYASLSCERTEFSMAKFFDVWPDSDIIRLILETDPLSPLYTDSMGSLPLHIAAAHGRLSALRWLLIECPNSELSLNASGQNFIHIAVEKEKVEIVRYACERKFSNRILNAQDQDGNTALHLAVNNASENIFIALMKDRRVHLNFANKEGYTPLDLAFLSANPEVISKGAQEWIFFLLLHGGGDFGIFSWDHLTRNVVKRNWEKEAENVGKSASMLTVCAVLILNAALLAPFNVLSHKDKLDFNGFWFKTFVALDTATFVSSAAATFFYARAGFAMSDGSTRLKNLVTGTFFIAIAALAVMCTVALALFLVLPAKAAYYPVVTAGWGIGLYTSNTITASKVINYLAALRVRVGIFKLASILLFQRSTIKPPWVVPSASTSLFWIVASLGIMVVITRVVKEKIST